MEIPPLSPVASTLEIWKARNDPQHAEELLALLDWIRDEVRRHSAYPQLQSYADADDLASEVIVRGLRDARLESGSFDGHARGALRAYLRRFVDSVVIDAIRRRCALKRGAGRADESLADGATDDGGVQAASPDPTPSQQSMVRELDSRILALLDESESTLYRLHAIEGLTFLSIAERTGETESAVRSRYHRLTKKLDLRLS